MYNLIDYNIITLWFYFIPLQKCYFMLLVCRGCRNILPSFYVIGLSWVSKNVAIILCYGSCGCQHFFSLFYVLGLSRVWLRCCHPPSLDAMVSVQ